MCVSLRRYSFLEKDTVADFVVFPDFLKDETVFRGTLKSTPSAEKHVRIGLATEAREGANTQDKAEHLIAKTGHHRLQQCVHDSRLC